MISNRKGTIENVIIRLFNDIFSIAMNSHEIQFEMSRKIFKEILSIHSVLYSVTYPILARESNDFYFHIQRG